MEALDKVNLKKYLKLINLFCDMQIDVKEFETHFIKLRREDSYWMSGSFEQQLGQILYTLFLDISDYTPNELYDVNDPININESELRIRVNEARLKLEAIK
ncbi:colicin immunity domain-containing protein [Mucilaginibacter flavus]|uniref:colicin immunity domain-containing protein n=1 Tax=Mucilaginibacter flavus TaxID=931504 RepID=UPI0025B4E266|nr:colicin immunity domain-containing protein [Mucilaginibacter flavus]MDN3584377.1 colicin immunity domain-containing protein [Mucilaginibacter flavus]